MSPTLTYAPTCIVSPASTSLRSKQVEGLEVLTAQTILSEVGLDPSRFASQKRFTSWMGLCPVHLVTGGKVKSSSTRYVNNRAARAVCRPKPWPTRNEAVIYL